MANTTVVTGRFVEITGLDADWAWSEDLPEHLQGKPLRSIQFNPSAVGDKLVVRNDSQTGARVFEYTASADIFPACVVFPTAIKSSGGA